MKIATLHPDHDEVLRAYSTVDRQDLTFDAFQELHGGDFAAADSLPPLIGIPEGFRIWRTKRGQLMAIETPAS